MNELIALDWGTSSLRAFLMRDGQVVEERASPHGIQKLPAPGGEEGYRAAFSQICGDWCSEGRPMVAGGMVGSQQGWVEAPYVRCPAAISDLAARSAQVKTPCGGDLHIVPGVLLDDLAQSPDVIRGEEIQIAGALAGQDDWQRSSLFVMPGTHSKWVTVQDGTIVTFATYMTGEIFAVMSDHSILGRLMTADVAAPEVAADAFCQGLEIARKGQAGDLGHQLFSTRTVGLTRRLPNAALRDYLSGMLIGNEILSASRALEGRQMSALLMIGEGRLCERYREAMEVFGLSVTAQLGNTAPRGLWSFAETRGLVSPRSVPSLGVRE